MTDSKPYKKHHTNSHKLYQERALGWPLGWSILQVIQVTPCWHIEITAQGNPKINHREQRSTQVLFYFIRIAVATFSQGYTDRQQLLEELRFILRPEEIMKNIPFEKKYCEELFQNFPPKLPRSQHPALAIKREVPPVLSCGQSCKHEAKMAGGPGCRKDDVTPHPQQSTSNMAEKPVQYTLEKIMEMSRVGFTWEL